MNREFKINCRTCYDTKTIEEIEYTGDDMDGIRKGQRFQTHERFVGLVYLVFGYEKPRELKDIDRVLRYYENQRFVKTINSFTSIAMECPICDSGRMYKEVIEIRRRSKNVA